MILISNGGSNMHRAQTPSRGDARVGQQRAGSTRILGRDDVGITQHVDGSG